MHYYSFNIADYRKDADWLSVCEAGIYRWLIDQYYLEERPIDNDLRLLMRRLHLTSDQKELLTSVLQEFFVLEGEAWRHERIDEEIEQYHAKIEQARQAGMASGKARKRKRTTVKRPLPSGSTDGQPTINQEPLTNNQEPDKDIAADAAMPKQPACPYQRIVDLYHEVLPQHPRVKVITDKRKSHIKARWMNGANSLKFWRDYFETVAASKFLTGNTMPSPGRKVFVADIDFLIREDVLVKTQEGKYHE